MLIGGEFEPPVNGFVVGECPSADLLEVAADYNSTALEDRNPEPNSSVGPAVVGHMVPSPESTVESRGNEQEDHKIWRLDGFTAEFVCIKLTGGTFDA